MFTDGQTMLFAPQGLQEASPSLKGIVGRHQGVVEFREPSEIVGRHWSALHPLGHERRIVVMWK